MAYLIKWDPKALSFVEKLPRNIAQRIFSKLDEVAINPFHYLEHYESKKLKAYKLRIGDYRALIDVDDLNKILKIRVLKHRRNIYKNI